MQRDGEDEAWRGIVENFGERVELDDDPLPEPGNPEPGNTERLERLFTPLPSEQVSLDSEPDAPTDRFVPPVPPPVPRLPPDRLAAWAGVLGSPAVLLVCLILSISLPTAVAYLLVAAFIGGFVYLVIRMPKRGDIDPWDDGARV